MQRSTIVLIDRFVQEYLRTHTVRQAIIILLALLLALQATAALAHTWLPPTVRTYTSGNGRFRLTIVPARLPERRPDMMLPQDDAQPRPGEKRLAWCQGLLFEGKRKVRTILLCNRVSPLRAMVSDDGRYVVTFYSWGYLGHYRDAIVVYRDGRLVASHALNDVFTRSQFARMVGFPDPASWWRGAWFDEARGCAVVVAYPTELRVLDLRSGTTRQGTDQQVRNALARPLSRVQSLPLELVAERKIAGTMPRLRVLVRHAGLPATVRVRAAVALAVLGDNSAADVVLQAAQRPEPVQGEDTDMTRLYAVEHLALVIGKRSIPILRQVIDSQTRSTEVWIAAYQGLATQGREGIAALVDLMRTGREEHDRGHAAEMLGSLHDPIVLPSLLAATAGKDSDLAGSACQSAIKLGKARIAPQMAAILRDGCSQDEAIAGYFRGVRLKAAVPALVTALRRHPQEGPARSAIVGALEFQTGAHLGTDPDAWAQLTTTGQPDAERGRMLLSKGDATGLLWLARAAANSPEGRRALVEAEATVPCLVRSFGVASAYSASFSPNGRAVHIQLRDPESTWTAWDLSTGARLASPVARGDDGGPYVLDFDKPGRGIFTGEPRLRSRVRVVDARTRKVISTIRPPGGFGIAWLEGEGRMVLTDGGKSGVCLWDARSGRLHRSIPQADWRGVSLDQAMRTVLIERQRKPAKAHSPAPNGGADFCVEELSSGRRLGTFTVGRTLEGSRLTPDGQRVVTVEQGGIVRFWSSEGKALSEPRTHPRSPRGEDQGQSERTSLQVSPDGSLCATTRGSSVQVWRTADGSAATPFFSHASEVTELGFNGNATLLATDEQDGRVHTWDLRRGTERGVPISRDRSNSIGLARPAFAPNGHLLVLTFEQDVRVLDVCPEPPQDLDIDTPAALLELEAQLWIGYRLDGSTAIRMTPQELDRARIDYRTAAEHHAARCQCPEQNQWLRAHPRQSPR